MVEKAFLNVDNYMSFFKDIDNIYKEKDAAFNAVIAEVYEKYGFILESNEEDAVGDENTVFLVPRPIKSKNGSKGKLRSSQATANRILNNTTINNKSRREIDDNETNVECLRKSSRITNKTKNSSILASKRLNSEDELVLANETSKGIQQRALQNAEIDELQDQMQVLSLSQTSISTERMKDPVGCSTPTTGSPEVIPSAAISNLPDNEEQMSTLKPENEEKSESVKKRIEQFEKRAKILIQPVKLPMKTPEKKTVSQSSVAKFKKTPTLVVKPKLRSTNARVLREKNCNIVINSAPKIKAVREKIFTVKQKSEDSKSKREERCRKLATQREVLEKKKLNVVETKKKELKSPRESEDDMELEIPIHQIQKQPVTCKVTAPVKSVELVQYPFDHLESGCSEDEEHPKSKIPSWASKENREYPLKVQAWLGKEETVYKWFYSKNLKTPNLAELFSCRVKMRPRTSSAVWNTKSLMK